MIVLHMTMYGYSFICVLLDVYMVYARVTHLIFSETVQHHRECFDTVLPDESSLRRRN